MSIADITKAHLVANRMRWAAAFLGSAGVLGVGLFLWGGYKSFVIAPVGLGIRALALLLATLGLFACLGALVVAFESAAPTVAGIGKREPVRSQQLSRWSRIMLALPFTVLALLIVAAGVLHITVWNPLARVPGLSLDEIYSAMSTAGEAPLDAFVVVWALFWAAAAASLPILSSVPGLAWFSTVRRIVVAGLVMVGAAASCHWLAGFNMGMSLADTFMTSGGDAAVSGPIIAIVGQTALVAALLIGLTPRRYAAGMVTARPTPPARPR